METRISIIGSGNIAHSLIPNFIKSGFTVDSIVSRNYESAKNLALQNKIEIFSNHISDVYKNSEYYILAVNDDQIKNAADELSMLEFEFLRKKFIHLSGSQNIEALNSLKNKGGKTASIHFMKSFPNHNIQSLVNCFASIETEEELIYNELQNFTRKLNAKPFRLNSENKILYHLMGVFALNFTSANFANTEIISNFISNDLPDTSEIFGSNTQEVVRNYIKEKNLYNSLSGPIKREEYSVIESHLNQIEKLNDSVLYLSYIANSLSIIKLIEKEKEGSSESFSKIKKLLIDRLKMIDLTKI